MDRELLKTLPVDLTTLGEPLATFRTSTFQFVLLWVIAVGGIVLGAALAVVNIVLLVLFRGPQGHGDFVWIILGTAAVVLGVITLRRTRQSGGVRVFVFAQGLACVQGETFQLARWDEIEEVRRSLTTDCTTEDYNRPVMLINGMPVTSGYREPWLTMRTPARLLLRCCDGRELEFNETLAGLPELRRLVEERTLPVLLPAVREAYDAGQPLRFGAVRVDGDGLHYFQKTLPWDRVGPAEASGGRLTVRPADGRGAGLQVPFVDVPNVHVLLALIEHARGRRG